MNTALQLKNILSNIFESNRSLKCLNVNKEEFDKLKEIYEVHKNCFLQAIENEFEDEQKLCLLTVLESKHLSNEAINFMESKLKEMFFSYFDIDKSEKFYINNFISGKTDVLLNKFFTKQIKSDTEIRIYTSILYEACKHTNIAKNILLLMSKLNNYKTIDYIINYDSIDYIFEFLNVGENRVGINAIKISERANDFNSFLKALNISEAKYLSWAAYQIFNVTTSFEDKIFLRKYISIASKENKELFLEAINITHDGAKNYLESYALSSIINDLEIKATQICIEVISEILHMHNFSKNEVEDFSFYMRNLKKLKDVSIPSHFKTNNYSKFKIPKSSKPLFHAEGRDVKFSLKQIVMYWDVKTVFDKIILYVIKLDNPELFGYLLSELYIEKGIFHEETIQYLIDELNVKKKDLKYMLSNLALKKKEKDLYKKIRTQFKI